MSRGRLTTSLQGEAVRGLLGTRSARVSSPMGPVSGSASAGPLQLG